jgi:hypothetical protein
MTDDDIKKLATRLRELELAQPGSEDGSGRTVLIRESYGGELSVVEFFLDGKELNSSIICDTLSEALETIKEGPHDKADQRRWKTAQRRAYRKAWG